MRVLPVILVMLCLITPPALSALDRIAQDEIDYLLKYIETSDCRFIRSGTEYGPKEAAAHLRMKLGKAGSRVHSAEEFITGIASKSYLTGKPYVIKLRQGSTQPAGPWLSEALALRRRALTPK